MKNYELRIVRHRECSDEVIQKINPFFSGLPRSVRSDGENIK